MLDFNSLIQLVLATISMLVGFPTLLSTLVTALEWFNWLAPENADTFLFWGNALAFGGVFYFAVTGQIDLVAQIDLALGSVAKLLTLVLIILGVPAGFSISRAHYTQLVKARFLGLR